jgi:hypothetical protein
MVAGGVGEDDAALDDGGLDEWQRARCIASCLTNVQATIADSRYTGQAGT